MPIGLHRCHKTLGLGERWQFEDAIQPGEQVAAFAQCATKHRAFGIDQIEPEAQRRDHLFGGNNHTYGAGGSNRD